MTIRDLIADIIRWWSHRQTHAPRPAWRQTKARYERARRQHHGQGDAWRELRRATNDALRRELRRA